MIIGTANGKLLNTVDCWSNHMINVLSTARGGPPVLRKRCFGPMETDFRLESRFTFLLKSAQKFWTKRLLQTKCDRMETAQADACG